MNLLHQARVMLDQAFARAKANNRATRAAKIHKAQTDLGGPLKPAPAPQPAQTTVRRLLAAVHSQIGYHEGRDKTGHWNNIEKFAALVGLGWVSTQGLPWCCVFTSWGYKTAGLVPDVDYPNTASCLTAMSWYKARGRWSDYPAIGAQVIYGGGEHTGTVVSYDGTNVVTVEGNTNDSGSPEGDGVYQKTHVRTIPYITGYGYPKFPEGIVSADPSWKGRK